MRLSAYILDEGEKHCQPLQQHNAVIRVRICVENLSSENGLQFFSIETTVGRGYGRPDLAEFSGCRGRINMYVGASGASTGLERYRSALTPPLPRLCGIQIRPAFSFLFSLWVSFLLFS